MGHRIVKQSFQSCSTPVEEPRRILINETISSLVELVCCMGFFIQLGRIYHKAYTIPGCFNHQMPSSILHQHTSISK